MFPPRLSVFLCFYYIILVHSFSIYPGADGVSVTGVTINEDNRLVITLSEGDPIIIDKTVVGADGKNGNGISKVTLTTDFYLVFDYTDGTSSDKIGPIKGRDGENGKDGLTPILTLSENGDLSVKYGESGNLTLLGNIKGAKGDTGDTGDTGATGAKGDKGDTGAQGEKGENGRGIAKTEIVNGELIITYSDGSTQSVGKLNDDSQIKNEIGLLEYCEYYTISPDGTYGVCLKSNIGKYATSVVVPSMFNGKPVTKVGGIYGARGFGSSTLTQILLPDTIVSIGADAFKEASSLTRVNIPSAVTTIGEYAFYGCSKLQKIVIPANVTKIGAGAFANAGLTEIVFENPSNWIGYFEGQEKYATSYTDEQFSDKENVVKILQTESSDGNYKIFERTK